MSDLPAQDHAGQRQQVFPRLGFALFLTPDGRDDGEGLCVLSPGEVETVVGYSWTTSSSRGSFFVLMMPVCRINQSMKIRKTKGKGNGS